MGSTFFLMPQQQIVIAEKLRIAAVFSDERVDELIVAQGRYQIGDVYLGTVENVLPGIDAATEWFCHSGWPCPAQPGPSQPGDMCFFFYFLP